MSNNALKIKNIKLFKIENVGIKPNKILQYIIYAKICKYKLLWWQF
jgi:hypothetical protein